MTEREYQSALERGAKLNEKEIQYRMKPDCLNIPALAAAINVPTSNLRDWMDGLSMPDLRRVRKLAGVLFCCVPELLIVPENKK